MPKDTISRFFCLVEGCGTSVSRKSDLARHHRDKHATAPKEYICRHCCFSTTQKGNLTSHQRRHNGLVLKCPFTQNGCTYETTHASALSRHKRILHTVEFYATKEAYAAVARPSHPRPRNKHFTIPRRVCDDEPTAEPLFVSFTPKDDPGLTGMMDLPPFDPFQHPWNELVKPILVCEDSRATSVESGYSDTEGSSNGAARSEGSREASPLVFDPALAHGALESPSAPAWTWTIQDLPSESDASKPDSGSSCGTTATTTDQEAENQAIWNNATPVPPSPFSRRTSPSLARDALQVPKMAVMAPFRHLRECDDIEAEVARGTDGDFWQDNRERMGGDGVSQLPCVPASANGKDKGYDEVTSSQPQESPLEGESSQPQEQEQEQELQGPVHPLAFLDLTSATEPQQYFIPSDGILQESIDFDPWAESGLSSTESALVATTDLFDYASYGHKQVTATPEFPAPVQNLEVTMGRVDYGADSYPFRHYLV